MCKEDEAAQWKTADEEWQQWKTKFAGKVVVKSAHTKQPSRVTRTITADELLRKFGSSAADPNINIDTEPIDILEIEEGRVLSQDEEDFLDGKFQLRVDEEESKSELEALPQRVLELLRDNRHDFLEDLKWEDYDEIGLVSQETFNTVLMEGGESGTALGPMLLEADTEALRTAFVDRTNKKVSISMIETVLEQESVGNQKRIELYFGSDQTRVSLSVPADPSALLDDAIERLDLAGNPDDFIPYYVQLWPSALALAAEFLQRPERYRGKRVVEISAGMGLPGVAAGVAGAKKTLLTEYDEIATASIARNAWLNKVHAQTTLLDWFRPTGSELTMDIDAWDVFALADVMYESRFVEPVAGLVASLLRQNRGSSALFTDPQRASLPDFQAALEAHGLQVEKEVRLVNVHRAPLSRPLDSDTHAIALLNITLPE